MSFFQKLVIITRAYSLTTSSFSVVLGTVLAVFVGKASFHGLHFLLALVAMVTLHISANILSDIYDFRKGIDTEALPGGGGIVYDLITIRQAKLWIAATFLIGGGIGLYLTLAVSMTVLWIGLAGIALGFLYPAMGHGLKYHALGDLCVFLVFGILGTLGAWAVQTGGFSWFPMLCGIPSSLLVVAILHVNNWRDIERDAEVGAQSVASVIGDRASYAYFYVLVFGAYLLTALLVAAPYFSGQQVPSLPVSCLFLLLLSIPQAVKLIRMSRMKRNPETYPVFLGLLEQTAKFHTIFSLCFIAGLIVNFP